MPDMIFNFNSFDLSLSAGGIVLCTVTSLVTGMVTAAVYAFRNVSSRDFIITLAILPVIVQSIIMLVNGNVGTGVAVMGAFSLIRFRSVPGTAKEIAAIFLAMALGLAAGTGHILYALIFAVVINAFMAVLTAAGFGVSKTPVRNLKIVIPEDTDYVNIFGDLFSQYTKSAALEKVRTVNLGSLYELHYTVTLKDQAKERELLDKIRERNSNLEISCGRPAINREEL
ncbi:MAG: DUF4956 domain-containing protein [Treponema sp.]|jgi:uncharacterized membrane protein YhiD involved in acid resistance|nr:DUF4956 domain-containing protein [Treponema sp.]